jgi:hypothetical protein
MITSRPWLNTLMLIMVFDVLFISIKVFFSNVYIVFDNINESICFQLSLFQVLCFSGQNINENIFFMKKYKYNDVSIDFSSLFS